MEEYCPQGENRIYLLVLFSIVLTSTLTASSSMTRDIVNSDTYITGIVFNIICAFYTLYILWVAMTGETWEKSWISPSQFVEYSGFTEGNISDMDYSFLARAAEDLPCHVRSRGSCTIEPNVRDCSWDYFDQKCKAPFSGGYGNFLIFLASSIYLVIIGFMLIKENEGENRDENIDKLSTATIIVGSIGILFSLIDMFFC